MTYKTKAEAAEYLSVSQGTLDRWVRDGKLTRHKIQGTESVRFLTEELDALVVPETRVAPTTLRKQYPSEYGIWLGIQRRVKDVNDPNYGGRGISMCDEWMGSFEAFLKHIGPRPTGRHSVDRIDVNGNYEPGNVRWATSQEQHVNKRPHRNKQFGDFEDGRYTRPVAA